MNRKVLRPRVNLVIKRRFPEHGDVFLRDTIHPLVGDIPPGLGLPDSPNDNQLGGITRPRGFTVRVADPPLERDQPVGGVYLGVGVEFSPF